MRRFGKIALAATALGCGLAALQWLAATGPRERAERAPRSLRSRPADPPPRESERPPIDFGGAYGESVGAAPGDSGLAHYALGAQLLSLGDYYTAASHLATARAGLGDYGRICELLAITYDRLNMTLDLLEIMPCLEREARERPSARLLFERLSREIDVEVEFQAAASDHFVASFPSVGASAASIGRVLDILEQARRRIASRIGFASMRLVPVVVYEGGQFEAATDKPHWASGLYDGKIRIAIETYRDRQDFFETALTHEYVHALTHEYTGTRLPSWFREGLADNLARSSGTARGLGSALLFDRDPLLDIDELSGNFTNLREEMALRAYRQSFAMVRNLVREAGWDAIGDLLLDLHENRSLGFDDAFTDLYGETPADYLDRWYDVR
jgi:hypothetical protein